ncbi:MAG: hypothetical protein JSW08_01250 [archaeon]|nr:MAG: hypothetical protein JSW08_01250 [archaeon]
MNMINAPYDKLIERIAISANLPVEDIKRKIEAKRAKLSGLISNEGAAQIVAAELGISFESQEMKINDLLQGMRKVNITGKVINMFPIRQFQRSGKEAEVASFEIADSTGSTRIVLWDTHHIELIKNETIKENSVVEIKKADVRGRTNKEVHLGSISELKLSDKVIDKITKTEEKKIFKKISGLQKNEGASIRATIVQMFNPSTFSVCPECNMKANYENEKYNCLKHGIIIPKKRVILNAVADDGSGNFRVIFFHENALKMLGVKSSEEAENPSLLIEKKQEILGTEYSISGRVKKNVFFDRNEFIASDFSATDVEEIIKQTSK